MARARLLLWAVLSAAAAVAGCGSPRPPAASVIELRVAGADAYVTAPTGGGVQAGDDSSRLRAAVQRAALVARRPLEGDGRLAVLARQALLHADGDVASRRVLEAYARHLGIVDTGLHLVVLPARPAEGLEDALTQAVLLRASSRPITHYGIARVDQRLALVLSRRALELSPLPRRVEVGSPIAVRGRAAGVPGALRIEYVDPQRRRHRLPVADPADLHVRVPTTVAGRYVVEVLAARGGQPDVLARLPVHVGVDPPRVIALGGRLTDAQLRAGAAELFDRVNAARRAAGLQALETAPRLSALARDHARALRDRSLLGFGATHLPTPIERVRRAGLDSGLVLDAVARGVSAPDLHAQLVADAGVRNRLLASEPTHLGIGVVEGVGDELIATVVLLRMTGWLDVTEGRGQLLSRINAVRQGRGLATLALDPDLAAVANDSAHAFFQPPFPEESRIVAGANRRLDGLAIAYARVAATMAVTDDLASVSTLEPALDAAATHVGIGLAQGDHPRAGARRIAVVLTLGHAR